LETILRVPTLFKYFLNFGPETAKIGPQFMPRSVNSAFYFTAILRIRRSANGTQPNLAKRWG